MWFRAGKFFLIAINLEPQKLPSWVGPSDGIKSWFFVDRQSTKLCLPVAHTVSATFFCRNFLPLTTKALLRRSARWWSRRFVSLLWKVFKKTKVALSQFVHTLFSHTYTSNVVFDDVAMWCLCSNYILVDALSAWLWKGSGSDACVSDSWAKITHSVITSLGRMFSPWSCLRCVAMQMHNLTFCLCGPALSEAFLGNVSNEEIHQPLESSSFFVCNLLYRWWWSARFFIRFD